MTRTRHTCPGKGRGRRVPGCPRCTELTSARLAAGMAPPVSYGFDTDRAYRVSPTK